MKFKTDEVELIINILENLRKHFNITKSEIDKKSKLNAGQYGRMILRNQKIDIESLKDICKNVYNLTIKETLNLENEFPNEDKLPTDIQILIKGRTKVREQVKRNFPSHLFIIIDKTIQVGDIIHNDILKSYLPDDLKSKAIELDKTSIKNFVVNINEGKKGTKKQFKLVTSIPENILSKAQGSVDALWLNEFIEDLKKV
ncbi:hypothetical protein KO02_13330 [Sphingobacterium sp. ML3W]|uniref:hypothetical protein n=1 Tax=Sphingobacterium sp. ML3W TaxID=1538644 RepID=UPI0004F595DF|nr:hypothetical protein [Sphingobacterium sp. ML3W]AIM37560.1 hypothetical protein KO02_13330 [Sphingobacterium sp. ML3W]